MLSLLAAAAEPSKVPWFIGGGVLAVWAVILSAFGLNHPEFPANKGVRNLAILVTFVLMAAAMTTAVATG